MQINFLAEEKGKQAGACVWRALQSFSCSPLVVWKVQQHKPGRAVVYQATLTKGNALCQPSSWPGRRADSQSGSPVLGLKRMARHRGPLVAPPPLPRCTAAAWNDFYKHFASGSIPVLIKHCESDPSKTQSSPELRDGRSEIERLQRGWRKRERVHSNSEREKRLKGKRSESEREADAVLKAGGRQVFGQAARAR